MACVRRIGADCGVGHNSVYQPLVQGQETAQGISGQLLLRRYCSHILAALQLQYNQQQLQQPQQPQQPPNAATTGGATAGGGSSTGLPTSSTRTSKSVAASASATAATASADQVAPTAGELVVAPLPLALPHGPGLVVLPNLFQELYLRYADKVRELLHLLGVCWWTSHHSALAASPLAYWALL